MCVCGGGGGDACAQGIKGTVRVLVRARPPDALDADGTRTRAPGPADSTLTLHGAGRLNIAVAGRGAVFDFDRTFGFMSQQVRRGALLTAGLGLAGHALATTCRTKCSAR